jgi:hypothetical protein
MTVEKTTLTRGAIPYQARTVAWYDPVTGEILDERDETPVKMSVHAGVVEVLRNTRARMLYILPDEHGHVPGRSWYAECVQIGCKVDKYLAKVHAATVSRGAKVIDIFPVTQYFDTVPGVQACKQSWQLMASLLRGSFGEHAVLMGTAAATGQNLLRLSLPRGQAYQALPKEIQEVLFHNFGQGRIETFYRPATTVPTMYEIDGTWMYASCSRDCPTGECVHDEENGLLNGGKSPAFYRVEAQVPENWHHVGLLPAYDEEAARRNADIKTCFPNEPGRAFESWCTNSELRLADESGWAYTILERIHWPQRSNDPLRLWLERLKRLRERCDFVEEPQRTMLRQAIRAIVLKAIGSFYRHIVVNDGYVPLAESEQIPEFAEWEAIDENTIYYREESELSDRQQQMLQPHWACWIWGNARTRLTRAALALPFESIAALRTDGIWTTYDVGQDSNPLWEDTGKPGSWRKKYELHDVHWPETYGDMLSIITIAKKSGRRS